MHHTNSNHKRAGLAILTSDSKTKAITRDKEIFHDGKRITIAGKCATSIYEPNEWAAKDMEKNLRELKV